MNLNRTIILHSNHAQLQMCTNAIIIANHWATYTLSRVTLPYRNHMAPNSKYCIILVWREHKTHHNTTLVNTLLVDKQATFKLFYTVNQDK